MCVLYIVHPLARTSRVCTMYIRRSYSMVGVHSYEHAQQTSDSRPKAARACHPSAARQYSQHTGWESTEWVCCASVPTGGCGGQRAGKPSLLPTHADPCHRLPISPSHRDSTKQQCNPSELRGPVTHPRWRKAQQPEKPSSTVDSVVQNFTSCGTQYLLHDDSTHSPESRRYAALLLKNEP